MIGNILYYCYLFSAQQRHTFTFQSLICNTDMLDEGQIFDAYFGLILLYRSPAAQQPYPSALVSSSTLIKLS